MSGSVSRSTASHAYRVEGRSEKEGTELIDAPTAHATRPEVIYTHAGRPGEVLIWGQRGTMQRGRPWPYDAPRTLASICISASDAHGLEAMRPVLH